MFKGQDSRVLLKAVCCGAEVVVDGPGALHGQSDLVAI